MQLIDGFHALNRVFTTTESLRRENLATAFKHPWHALMGVKEPNRWGALLYDEQRSVLEKTVLDALEAKQKTERLSSRVDKDATTSSGNGEGRHGSSRRGGHGRAKSPPPKGSSTQGKPNNPPYKKARAPARKGGRSQKK